MAMKVVTNNANASTSANGSGKTLFFRLFAETKGAVRYQEVEQDGTPTDAAFVAVGSLYLRKSWLGKGVIPQAVTIQLTAE